MKKMDDEKDIADKILHDSIMEEGKRLDQVLGPVTYENPKEYDMDAGFQKLLQMRAKLKEDLEAYEPSIKLKDEAKVFKTDVTLEDEAEVSKTDVTLEDEVEVSNEDRTAKEKTDSYRKKENEDGPLLDKREKDSKTRIRAASRRDKGSSFGVLAKAALIVLAAGLCVFGFSMRSEATRMWWMESLGWQFGSDSATQVDNDEEREKTELPEWDAASEIEKALGIKAPKFPYMPPKCVYSDCTYDNVICRAIMYYKIQEEYLTVNMTLGVNDYASSANFDGSVIQEEDVATIYGTVTIRVVQGEEQQKFTVVAEWDYLDVHYEVFGRIPREEMVKIIEHMVL